MRDGRESLTWVLSVPPSQEPGKHSIVTVARLQEPPCPEQGRELGRYVQRASPCSSSHHTRGFDMPNLGFPTPEEWLGTLPRHTCDQDTHAWDRPPSNSSLTILPSHP